jgi:excisionase family DNA binding protein
MDKQNLLTVPEASEVLRLKPSTVRSWILKRRLPFIKLGSRVFLRKEDCFAIIEAGLRLANPTGDMEGATGNQTRPSIPAPLPSSLQQDKW